MADYDEAGYYEIQLNNKQLVFFFMAAVAIAVVIFLCGVMVGRGVRETAVAAGAGGSFSASFPEQASPTPAEVRRELDFPQRLESAEVDDRLETPAGKPERAVPESEKPGPAKPEPSVKVTEAKKPPAQPKASAKTLEPKPSAKTPEVRQPPPALAARPAMAAGVEQGIYVVQVVALKTREAADALVKRLKSRNYRAYLEPEDASGLFRVRVGRFNNRADAEQVAQKLRDVEKFKPYITQ